MNSDPGGPSAEQGPEGSEAATAAVHTDEGRAARLVATGIFLSRIAGFLRERVFSYFFGTSLYASAWRAALRMPNALQNLLGEGTLSASFIPVYSALLEEGRTRDAGRVAGAVFGILAVLSAGLVVLGVLLAPFIVSVFSPGFEGEQRAVTITLVRIIFPMTGTLVLSAWALGILNSHRHFFVPYVAPVLWNLAMIAALLGFGFTMGGGQRQLVIVLGWAALVGGVLQLAIQLPWVLRLERELGLRPGAAAVHVRTILRNAGPAILGRGVVQLSGYVDLILASFLFAGAVAVLGYAQTFYMLPVSLFGMAIAAAELPELSRAGAARAPELRGRVERALRRMAFWVVPSAAAFVMLGDVIVAALYQTGAFTPADTLLVWLVLAAYTIGLLASTATRLYINILYAFHDTRTPALVALLRVLMAAALGFTLMVYLEDWAIQAGTFAIVPYDGIEGLTAGSPLRPLGAVGLASGAGLAAWYEWRVLRGVVRGRLGPFGVGNHIFRRLAVAALAGGAAGRAAAWFVPPLDFVPADLGPAARAVVILGVFGGVYFGLASRFGIAEADAALARLTGRFRRRG